MITVKQLMDLLKDQDPNRVVVVQKDSEGNGYSPLSGVDIAGYRADTPYSGECGPEALTPELVEAGYCEEDVMEDGQPALVLYPVN